MQNGLIGSHLTQLPGADVLRKGASDNHHPLSQQYCDGEKYSRPARLIIAFLAAAAAWSVLIALVAAIL